MKKNKFKTLSIPLMLLITSMIIFSSVQESNALPKELKDIRDGTKGHRLVAYNPETMTITTSEASHVLHGWTGLTKQELKDLEPFEVKVFVDDIEIELDNCEEKVGSGQDKTYNVWFYQTFETNYFTPGIYNWTVVWSDVTGIVWYQSHPLTVLNEPHRLTVYNSDSMTITTSERSFVKHGWAGLTDEDIENLEPLDVDVYLDGEEIELYPITEEIAENTYDVLFYNYFDAYYFEPGIYNWTVVWSDVTGIVWYQSHPLTVLNEPHRLTVYNSDSMTITTSERSYVQHGFGYPVSAFETVDFYNERPFNVQIYLDGEEIELYQKLDVDDSGEETWYWWQLYQNFDAHYFAPGIYNWTVVWSLSSELYWIRSHPLTVLEDSHRLNLYASYKGDPESLIITTSERSYIRHGWSWSPEYIEDVSFYEESFDFKLYIDDQEIDLYQKLETDYDEFGNPTYYSLFFYQNFDAGYFAPGIYNITAVWSSLLVSVTHSHPLIVLGEAHRLSILNQQSLRITTSERSYMRHGWGWSPEYIEDVSFYEGPFDFKLYIDDQEIDLYQKLETDYDEFGNPTYYSLFFYQNFDAGYFVPGEYDITGIWTDNLGVSYEFTRTLTVLEDGHQIIVYRPNTMTIFDSERSYIRHGWVISPEEFGNEEFYNSRPFEVQFEIDGQQIDLYQDFKIDYDEFGEIIAYHIWFYQTFDEYYFLPGTYDWTVKWFEGDGDYLEITETLYVVSDGLP